MNTCTTLDASPTGMQTFATLRSILALGKTVVRQVHCPQSDEQNTMAITLPSFLVRRQSPLIRRLVSLNGSSFYAALTSTMVTGRLL